MVTSRAKVTTKYTSASPELTDPEIHFAVDNIAGARFGQCMDNEVLTIDTQGQGAWCQDNGITENRPVNRVWAFGIELGNGGADVHFRAQHQACHFQAGTDNFPHEPAPKAQQPQRE